MLQKDRNTHAYYNVMNEKNKRLKTSREIEKTKEMIHCFHSMKWNVHYTIFLNTGDSLCCACEHKVLLLPVCSEERLLNIFEVWIVNEVQNNYSFAGQKARRAYKTWKSKLEFIVGVEIERNGSVYWVKNFLYFRLDTWAGLSYSFFFKNQFCASFYARWTMSEIDDDLCVCVSVREVQKVYTPS